MHRYQVRLRSQRATARRTALPPHPRGLRGGSERVAEALGAPLQTQLTLGSPEDAQEREADAMADRVMRMPDNAAAADGHLQRKCAECAKEDETLRRQAGDEPEEETVQRQADEEETEEVQRQSEGEEEEEAVQAKADPAAPATVATDTATRIRSARGSGGALPHSERAFFEPRMGADLSQVRVHRDTSAADLNRRLGARAFTVGHDVFFGAGEYRPGTPGGRRLMAHEFTHVLQQRGEGERVRRWNLGAAPAPHGWSEVTDPDHMARLAEAEAIVDAAISQPNCSSFFEDNCTDGSGATAARDTFDKANVYLRPHDDNVFGEGEFGGDNIAFNLRAFRIGKYMMASSLLHELFHNCDATGVGTGRAAELSAENATETCRLHTPWIDTIAPRSGSAGDRVTIRGWNFGPVKGGSDAVEIGGVRANIVRWEFMAGTSSRTEIIVEVPAGAADGLVVINNRVRSNTGRFRVV
ncbi:MAG: DUF4157 domain-containing protein [Rhodocyclaceae bacterium]|nr:DUF4157 domain-containing protein [Rhodocyclaceae bacterium]